MLETLSDLQLGRPWVEIAHWSLPHTPESRFDSLVDSGLVPSHKRVAHRGQAQIACPKVADIVRGDMLMEFLPGESRIVGNIGSRRLNCFDYLNYFRKLVFHLKENIR